MVLGQSYISLKPESVSYSESADANGVKIYEVDADQDFNLKFSINSSTNGEQQWL